MGIFSKWFGGKTQTEPSPKNSSTTVAQPEKTTSYSAEQPTKQRLKALKASSNIEDLLNAFQHDRDDVVVDCADMRLRELLLNVHETVAHKRLLEASLSLKTRKALAAKAPDESLRTAMLATIDDDQSLSEIIAHSDNWQIKSAAISRLNDTDTLRSLTKQYKGKQKAAYRAAKNRLDYLKTQQRTINDLQNRLAALIAAAEEHTLTISAVTQFEQHLNPHVDSLSATEQQQFTAPLDALHTAAKTINEAKNARHALLKNLEHICDTLQNQNFSGNRKTYDARINQLQHEWVNVPTWEAAESKALDIRFEQLLSETNRLANDFFDEKKQQNAQQKLLSQGQRWLTNKTFVTEDMLVDFDNRWAGLTSPADATLARSTQQQFTALLAQLRDKSQQQIRAQQANDEAVPQLLEQLQTALDNGESQQANRLHQQIREYLNSDEKLSQPVYQQISAPLKQLENRLHEFKQWQHFGDDQARQALIEQMQALADESLLSIEDKAEHIQSLQKQWKALKGRAPDALWQQFKAFGDTAWQPVSAHLDAKRQSSKTDLATRLTFLNTVEAELQNIDWHQPDWAAVNAAHKKFEQQWRGFPKLQEHDYRKAKKAYQRVEQLWQEHLGAERKRELQRRERLIAQASAQLDNEDTQAATEAIKQLQQQWAPTVGLKRRNEEQALWLRFKEACDAVFARHGEHREQAKTAANAAFDSYQSQIQTLAALLDSGQAFTQLQSDFNAQLDALQQTHAVADDADEQQQSHDFIGVSGKAAYALRQQLADVVKRFEAMEKNAVADKRLAYLKQLYQQDNLCIQLETAQQSPEQIAAIEQQWNSISPLLNDGQSQMAKRYAVAVATAQETDTSAEKVDNRTIEQAQEICLLLELTGELPSPDTAKPAREALRLKMLDAAMNGDKSFEQYQTEEGLYTLTQRWLMLNKNAFGTALSDWQARFSDNLTAVCAHYQLPPLDFAVSDLSEPADNKP